MHRSDTVGRSIGWPIWSIDALVLLKSPLHHVISFEHRKHASPHPHRVPASSPSSSAAQDKAAVKITEEEEKAMAAAVSLDGAKFVVEQVLNRRKFKSTMEYEVSFVGLPPTQNKWMPRRWLEERGYGKLVDQVDAREAAAQGLHAVPLTSANIARHLAEVGLEQEFTLHHRMRGLSGGQKVKVVLGAACWMRPHLLVLDEPTNYLDRDSLGALAGAIKDFGGGVVIISHAGEFINAVTTEKWNIGGGVCKVRTGCMVLLRDYRCLAPGDRLARLVAPPLFVSHPSAIISNPPITFVRSFVVAG